MDHVVDNGALSIGYIQQVLYISIIYIYIYIYYQCFLSQTLTVYKTAGEERGLSFIPLCHFYPLRTLRHLLATVHVRWLSHIFNRNACVYKTATRWDLPPYRAAIYCLIDDAMFVWFTWRIYSTLLSQRFHMGNRWIWTHIDYYSCTTSEPTNQVCWSIPKFLMPILFWHRKTVDVVHIPSALKNNVITDWL